MLYIRSPELTHFTAGSLYPLTSISLLLFIYLFVCLFVCFLIMAAPEAHESSLFRGQIGAASGDCTIAMVTPDLSHIWDLHCTLWATPDPLPTE